MEFPAAAGLTPEQVEKYTVRYTFRGRELSLLQTPRERSAGGPDNTGWCLWEASNVLLRWVAQERNLRHALGWAPDAAPPAWPSLRLLDMSAGAGLAALSVASAGARAVAASDIPEQLPQLRDNVRRSGFRVLGEGAAAEAEASASSAAGPTTAVEVMAHYWGADIAALQPASCRRRSGEGSGGGAADVDEGGDKAAGAEVVPGAWFDVALISDIVFIAIRDGRTAELERTIRELAQRVGCVWEGGVCGGVGGGRRTLDVDPHREGPTASRRIPRPAAAPATPRSPPSLPPTTTVTNHTHRCIVMSFEERLPDEEQAFMVRLGLGRSAGAGDSDRDSAAPLPPPLLVEELGGDAVTVDFEDRLEGAGGHADTSLFNPYLFWECPPIRMFVIRAGAGAD